MAILVLPKTHEHISISHLRQFMASYGVSHPCCKDFILELWIAESGGTKTDWLGLDRHHPPKLLSGKGLNPNVTGWQAIAEQLEIMAEQIDLTAKSQFFFFGAGLGSAENQHQMTKLLRQQFAATPKIYTASDLEAAALAGLGNRPGVVGILGTGSVAIRFDGSQITERRGGLGYLLGDDGGGGQLGQTFLRALLANTLETNLMNAHRDFFGPRKINWAKQVYSNANPVPTFTRQIPFISQFRQHPQIEVILKQQFELFFRNTLLPLIATPSDYVVLLGGIAREFKEMISRFATSYQIPLIIDHQLPILPLTRTLLATLENGDTFNTANIFDGSSETCASPG